MPTDRPLTAKQQRFLDALVAGATAADAYRQAYDCGRMRPKTVGDLAHRLTRHPRVAAALAQHRDRLDAARDAASERAAAQAGVTRERLIAELAAIAFADIRQVTTWADGTLQVRDAASLDPATAAAILELKGGARGGAISVKLHPKLGALQALAKLLKLDAGGDDAKRGGLSFVMRLEEP